MTRENKPDGATEKRNEYAYWAIPGANASVTYSLPLFHEIDFAVNEGYRKIPHGGIEEGGLLFGNIDGKGTRIEAFRPIVCEHSSGPSFLLSDRDLDLLSEQIKSSSADPDLDGMQVIGWFLAHTRGPLMLTDREAELCDRYFSQPGMITVLVKPERFQPTRFAFLVRGADDSLPREGSQNAIILPLPGRSARAANGPVASIPAPTTLSSAARRAADAEEMGVSETPPLEDDHAPSSPAVAAPKTPSRAVRRIARLNLEQVRPEPDEPQEEGRIQPADENELADETPARQELQPLRGQSMVASRTLEGSTSLRPTPRPMPEVAELADPYRQIELLNQKRPASSTARLVLVLPLAALLGCLVGYFAFLQVPSQVIPLTVKARGENVVVSWPPEQTRNASYAYLRVDDSTPVPLTPEEKSIGRVEVQARPDMRVELITHNWIHDSRGIVHYVKPVANTAP